MATTLEKLEATDVGNTISAVHWCESSHIELANGDIYSFEERPYLIDPLRTEARLVCVRKARGLGFSETEILRSIHGLGKGKYRQGVQYVFPTETAMREFVQSRFNVVIKKNPILRRMVQDTDTTYYKRIGEGNLFLNGGGLNTSIEGVQKESMAFRYKQIDLAIIDELDMFEEANDVIERALTSMMNSPTRAVIAISNPSTPNYGIDKLFQDSNQMFWYRQCKSCKELTCADKEFPNLVDKEGCHCHKCGGLLTYRGRWIPDHPERNNLYGLDSTDWEGYHISDLNAPMMNPYTLLLKSKDTSESNLEKFNKFYLGLPYISSSNKLTLFEIYSCCGNQVEYETYDSPTIMGVDVGATSGFHVVIGIRTGKDSYQILRVDCMESFDDVAVLGQRFKVKNCVCDMLPETTGARIFQKTAGFKVWLNLYNTSSPIDEVSWDNDMKVVKTYRNYIFDESHRVMAEGRVKLPRKNAKIEKFAKQYISPTKVPRPNKENEFFYRSDSPDDHGRNAMNYFLVAAMHSRITRPGDTHRKVSNKAVHETVRI
jgi:hypothetical protein